MRGGQRLQGQVRSFKGGWGFLRADGIPGDIFVGLKENQHLNGSLAEGDLVEFDLKHDSRGKKEATNVQLLDGLTPYRGRSPPRAARRSGSGTAASVPADGRRHSGWVRKFEGQWGFINSDDFEGDLFVGLRSNPHLSSLVTGDRVEFDIRNNDSGKNEAVEVAVTGVENSLSGSISSRSRASNAGKTPASGGRAEVGHLLGRVLTGSIRSFRDSWGFITSDQFQGDLFIHRRASPNLGPVQSGDPVKFEVAQDAQAKDGEEGQYQAVNVSVQKDDLDNLVGQRLFGWVKSFKDKWGLLNSQRFDGDLFVGFGTNPQLNNKALQQGEGVEFEVAPDDRGKGKFQAVQVSLTGLAVPLETIMQSAATREVPRLSITQPSRVLPLEECLGLACSGVVKSFRDGWGFVNSNAFEGDLFLHQGSNPGMPLLHAGDKVEFVVSRSQTGKLHATTVQVVPTELHDLVGQVCSGTIRTFKGEWGFVTSPSFNGDLFVGARSNALPVQLKTGDQIEFVVSSGSRKDGKDTFEAMSVKVLGLPQQPATVNHMALPTRGGATARNGSAMRNGGAVTRDSGRSRTPRGRAAADPLSLEGSVLDGQIRSFRGDWGFVTSPHFDGDLFIGAKSNRHLMNQLEAGDRIMFRVARGSGGKAEAIDVAVR
eukprot:TRINITY_DN76106_c0_g1_i1.p1 TRINITY_DN76106_c0_g1~~TRINITY_DN76106_c0_g1_i1.p1  ORF type:complete len:654 (-),score=113.74 TRINITY_DN76106_c0_g1_i1:101-2062(-)